MSDQTFAAKYSQVLLKYTVCYVTWIDCIESYDRFRPHFTIIFHSKRAIILYYTILYYTTVYYGLTNSSRHSILLLNYFRNAMDLIFFLKKHKPHDSEYMFVYFGAKAMPLVNVSIIHCIFLSNLFTSVRLHSQTLYGLDFHVKPSPTASTRIWAIDEIKNFVNHKNVLI